MFDTFVYTTVTLYLTFGLYLGWHNEKPFRKVQSTRTTITNVLLMTLLWGFLFLSGVQKR